MGKNILRSSEITRIFYGEGRTEVLFGAANG